MGHGMASCSPDGILSTGPCSTLAPTSFRAWPLRPAPKRPQHGWMDGWILESQNWKTITKQNRYVTQNGNVGWLEQLPADCGIQKTWSDTTRAATMKDIWAIEKKGYEVLKKRKTPWIIPSWVLEFMVNVHQEMDVLSRELSPIFDRETQNGHVQTAMPSSSRFHPSCSGSCTFHFYQVSVCVCVPIIQWIRIACVHTI